MKTPLDRIKSLISRRPQAWIAVLIFCSCVFVYLANDETISSTDNVPSSLLAFQWLDNHSLNFDDFRGGYMYRTDTKHGADGIPHFFVEAPNGHLSSTYPIGNVIVTFPLYFLMFVGIKIGEFYNTVILGNPVDWIRLTDPTFEGALQHYQKLVAVGVASFSTVLFYLITRLKFNGAIALLSTFIFGFATSAWVTGSQGLWQHGCSNLVVLSIIFCLLKANRTQGKNRKILLFLTGIFCGLLPGIRSTSLLYGLGAIAYSAWMFRQEVIYLFLGLPSALISASWNIYYFGFSLSKLIIGGYSRYDSTEASFTASYYNLTISQFLEGFFGLLVSPSRGILVFTPVSLLTIPGLQQLWRWRAGKDEQLILWMTGAAAVIFLQYCFFTVWTAGSCYGTRYLTDIMPVIGLLIAYFLASWVNYARHGKHRFAGLKTGLLTVLITLSLFTQTVGAFGSTNWEGIPNFDNQRIWVWHDNQIERHAKHVFYKIFDPMGNPQQYVKNWNGVIESVQKANGKSLQRGLEATPSRRVVLTAVVKNTGTVPWIGYETGLSRGRAQVGVTFIDRTTQQPVRIKAGNQSRLYISGSPQPGETVTAIGRVTLPQQEGDYRLVLDLGVGGMKKLEGRAKTHYEVDVRVVKPSE